MQKQAIGSLCLVVWITICLSCSNKPEKDASVITPLSKEDSIKQVCEKYLEELRRLINQDYNQCTSAEDCAVAYGSCPLGPYFLINKKFMPSFDSIKNLVASKCYRCRYDMISGPSTVICYNGRCFPGFNEDSNSQFIRNSDCYRMVQLYKDELVGRALNVLNLNERLYRVISDTDSMALLTDDPDLIDRVRIIVDKNDIVKVVECDVIPDN